MSAARPTSDDAGALVERARRELAADPRLGQLDVDVSLRAEVALVTGHAVTPERRDLIGERLSELLPGYEIHNATTTMEAMPEPVQAPDQIGPNHVGPNHVQPGGDR